MPILPAGLEATAEAFRELQENCSAYALKRHPKIELDPTLVIHVSKRNPIVPPGVVFPLSQLFAHAMWTRGRLAATRGSYKLPFAHVSGDDRDNLLHAGGRAGPRRIGVEHAWCGSDRKPTLTLL